MGTFRKLGKGFGELAGGLIGGGVKLAGKKMNSEWIQEVGDGIQTASTVAMDNAGQFVDGAIHGTYGIVTKDNFYKQKGLDDLKDSVTRTAQGLGSTIIYTAKSAGTTVQGVVAGNKEQTVSGLKNLGKVAAVSALAIGVIDVVDGADVVEAEAGEADVSKEGNYETRNAVLNGDYHPITAVPFEENAVFLPNGEIVEGVFPVFDTEFEAEIPEEYYLASDQAHILMASEQLYQAIQNNPDLAEDLQLSPTEVEELKYGITPEGYTWHHHEEPGVLQLVDEEQHHDTGHTGGRELWGGGALMR